MSELLKTVLSVDDEGIPSFADKGQKFSQAELVKLGPDQSIFSTI